MLHSSMEKGNDNNNDHPPPSEVIPAVVEVDFHSSKLAATLAACTTAGIITYPSEVVRLNFIKQTLSKWDFERQTTMEIGSTSSWSGTTTNSHSPPHQHPPQYQKPYYKWNKWSGGSGLLPVSNHFNHLNLLGPLKFLHTITSPLIRLVSYEAISVATYQIFEHYSWDDDATLMTQEVTVGALSGFSQALLFCPMYLHRAHLLKQVEETELRRHGGRGGNRTISSMKRWLYAAKSFMSSGGVFVGNPQERYRRAYRGVATLAAREMLFNISFFPLFYGLKRHLDASTDWTTSTTSTTNGSYYKQWLWNNDPAAWKNCKNYMVSGVLSGLVCSIVITPMDVLKTYMFHSREQWSLWSGKTKIVAPPLFFPCAWKE